MVTLEPELTPRRANLKGVFNCVNLTPFTATHPPSVDCSSLPPTRAEATAARWAY